MTTKTNTKGIVHSFSVNKLSSLSSPLLSDEMNESQWLSALSPLQFILMPIGINNLFPNQKHTKWQMLLSWIYPIALLPVMCWYLYTPSDNSFLRTTVGEIEAYLLYISYVFSIVNVLFVYGYIRWYYFKNQHHIFLMIHLYEYIKDSSASNNILLKYSNTIYNTCKYGVIFHYLFIISLTIGWLCLSFFGYYRGVQTAEAIEIAIVVILYDYQIWWLNSIGLIIFILNLKLLQLRYYAFSGKILSKSKEYNALLNINKLQEIYQNNINMNDNINLNSILNVNDLTKEYLDIITLFQKNCSLWSIYIIVKSIWLTLSVFQGFLIMWVSNQRHDKNQMYSAYSIWLCSSFLIVPYFIGMANLNKIPDDYSQLLTISYGWSYKNIDIDIDIDNRSNGLLTADILYLLQLAATNRCSFKIMNIELSMSMTIVLCTSAMTPLLAYVIQWYFASISFY